MLVWQEDAGIGQEMRLKTARKVLTLFVKTLYLVAIPHLL